MYSLPPMGILRTYQLTKWPALSWGTYECCWLDRKVGRALHRYRRGHGFESRSGLDFFQALISQLLQVMCITEIIIGLVDGLSS